MPSRGGGRPPVGGGGDDWPWLDGRWRVFRLNTTRKFHCRVCRWLDGRALDLWNAQDRLLLPPQHHMCDCRTERARWRDLSADQADAARTGTASIPRWDLMPFDVRDAWLDNWSAGSPRRLG